MRKLVVLMVLVCLLITACANQPEISVEDFSSNIQGFWVNMDSCKEMGPDSIAFSFVEFNEKGMVFGDYPGCYGPTGTIISVEELEEDRYNVTFHYEKTDGPISCEEEDKQREICFENQTFRSLIIDGETTYHYLGTEIEEAHDFASMRYRDKIEYQNESVSDISAEEAKRIANEYLISKETNIGGIRDGNITTYKYDNQNRLVWEMDGDTKTVCRYDYNSEGSLIRISSYDGEEDTTPWWVVEVSYDSRQYSTHTSYYPGARDPRYRDTVQEIATYNKSGQIVERTIPRTLQIKYTYNDSGDVTVENNIDIVNGYELPSYYVYEYNDYGLKVKKTCLNNGDYSIYEYDKNYCNVKISNYEENGKLESTIEMEYVKKVNMHSDKNGNDLYAQENTEKTVSRSGRLKYIIGDGGYYCLQLEKKENFNGKIYDILALPKFKNGELTEHLGKTITVEGILSDPGFLSMKDTKIVSVTDDDPTISLIEQALYKAGYQSPLWLDDASAKEMLDKYLEETGELGKFSVYGGCHSIRDTEFYSYSDICYLCFPLKDGKMTADGEFLCVIPSKSKIFRGYNMTGYELVCENGVNLTNIKEASVSCLTDYEPFNEKLAEYATAATMDEETFNVVYDNGNDCSSINAWSAREEPLSYTLYDVDKNGTPELFVGSGEYYNIIDFYLLNGDRTVKPFENIGYRSGLSVLTDGSLVFSGSNGMASGSTTIYSISADGSGLELMTNYYFDEDRGRDATEMPEDVYLPYEEYKEIVRNLERVDMGRVTWSPIN